MRILKKELIIFFVVFVLLSFLMHFDNWLSAPIGHLKNLPYHVFPSHPLVYSLIAYVVIWFFRFIFGSLFKK